MKISVPHSYLIREVPGLLWQRRLDPGMDTHGGFFQVRHQKEYQKNGNNVTCTSRKNEHFLFYAQDCDAKIEPAMPSWKVNLKWP